MAEDATPDPDADPVGHAPAVARAQVHPIVIEGDSLETRDPSAPEPGSPEPSAAEAGRLESTPAAAAVEPPPPSLQLPARKSAALFLSALLGAVVGGAAAFAFAWLYDPSPDQLREIATRQTALETAIQEQQSAATAVQELEKRLAALESSTVKPDALLAAQADASAARDAATKALAAAGQAGAAGDAPLPGPDPRIGKLESDLGALSARVAAPAAPDPRIGKLETDLSALSARVADLAGLGDRVGKMEGALAAPKSEARVAAEISKEVDPASQAVVAEALEQRLGAGEPFAAEWTALSRLGADPPGLATLKPYAETGAPTAAALAASFAKVAPAMLSAVAPESTGGAMDKLLDHMRKLVRVHAVGEIAGEAPDALISQIQAALARGQVTTAMAIYARLPEAARKASADWAKSAEARAAADAATRTLRENAIAHLAATKN